MNELSTLTKIDEKALSLIPKDLQPMVAAHFQQPIRQHSDNSLAAKINIMLTRASAALGHSDGDPKVKAFLTDETFKLLRSKYQHISFAEIEMHVNEGVLNPVEGRIHTLNMTNIASWIRKGIESESRKRALLEFHKQSEAVVKQSSEPVQITAEWWMQRSREAFEDYKKERDNPSNTVGGIYDKPKDMIVVKAFFSLAAAAGIYDFLNEKFGQEINTGNERIRTLVIDPAARKDLVSLAKAEYAAEKRELIKQGKLKKEDEEQYDTVSPKFKMMVKKHYLSHYFNELIEKGETL